MNTITKITLAIAGLFAFSTVICGVSISQAPTIDPSSIQVHMGFATVTLLAGLGTIFLMARQIKKP
jgi:hypothetical protein